MQNFKVLKTIAGALVLFAGLNLEAAPKKKAAAAPAAVLYPMDAKGRVTAIPLSAALLKEHNIKGKPTVAQLQLLAQLHSKNLLSGGKTFQATARKASTDEFNDAENSGKPALYFNVGFGNPYWGGYHNHHHHHGGYYGGYYNNYVPPVCHNNFFVPQTIYVGNAFYNPYCAPIQWNNFSYSYYGYGGC